MLKIVASLVILALLFWHWRYHERTPWSWRIFTMGFVAAVLMGNLARTAFEFAYPPRAASAAQVGTVLPPPGAVRPPSLQQQQMWREPGGPPTLPKAPPLIWTPQNPFLLPPVTVPTEKEAKCQTVANITTCQTY